jgi:DnaJ-class molecular chaperone
MADYKTITEARELLGLPEKATLESIKFHYRKMLTRWHPDKCPENPEEAQEMTHRIVEAYQTLLAYCDQYEYSFSEEEVRKYGSPDQWWFQRFGETARSGSVK